ncbi:hypothetical protein IWQ60_009653, partial [Tieghemiomyces parasiticus]
GRRSKGLPAVPPPPGPRRPAPLDIPHHHPPAPHHYPAATSAGAGLPSSGGPTSAGYPALPPNTHQGHPHLAPVPPAVTLDGPVDLGDPHLRAYPTGPANPHLNHMYAPAPVQPAYPYPAAAYGGRPYPPPPAPAHHPASGHK